MYAYITYLTPSTLVTFIEMYITYTPQKEGIGAQYQRIIALIAVCRVHGCRYIHTKVNDIEHNDDNIHDWDTKWDDLFGVYLLDQSPNIIGNLCHMYTQNLSLHHLTYNDNVCLHTVTPYDIVHRDVDMYYSSVLHDIRSAYAKKNKERICELFHGDTINIAIHMRVINKNDVDHTRGLYNDDHMLTYITRIHALQRLYPNSMIHIFTQTAIYNFNIEAFTNIPHVQVHVDYDTISTMHHMICADVLVVGRSSFSYLAGLYNTHTVYFEPFWIPPLSSWNNIESL